ncbi:unnamed protein product [Urochloa humidicola]
MAEGCGQATRRGAWRPCGLVAGGAASGLRGSGGRLARQHNGGGARPGGAQRGATPGDPGGRRCGLGPARRRRQPACAAARRRPARQR